MKKFDFKCSNKAALYKEFDKDILSVSTKVTSEGMIKIKIIDTFINTEDGNLSIWEYAEKFNKNVVDIENKIINLIRIYMSI